MTVTLSYESDAELVTKCREIIRKLEPCVERMTVANLARQVKRKAGSVSRSLHRRSCPAFNAIRGESGRILWLDVTGELIDFLT